MKIAGSQNSQRPRSQSRCIVLALLLGLALWGQTPWKALAADPPRPIERKLLWEGSVPAKPVPAPKSLRQARRALVPFSTAPFPYYGPQPRTDVPFFDIVAEGHRGRTLRSGEVRWEALTYSDNRVLLHLPTGFDIRQPGLIILFLHGNGAILERDVEARQQVPAQIAASGLNAALIAPQLAVDAADSGAGKFWRPGALTRFLDEAGRHLAVLNGHSRFAAAFARMPVVIIAYSGGYQPASWLLAHGGAHDRIAGVIVLDGLYGEPDHFADFIAANRRAFFVSAYGPSSESGNADLFARLTARDFTPLTALEPLLLPGQIVFQAAAPTASHANFVTEAWSRHPVADVLRRIPGRARRTQR